MAFNFIKFDLIGDILNEVLIRAKVLYDYVKDS